MKTFIITPLLISITFIVGCGAGLTSPSASNGPQAPVQSMICQSPMVPTFTNVAGSQNWIWFNGSTYTPYVGGCIQPGR